MTGQKKAKTNLEVLQDQGMLSGMTLDEAAEEMTDVLNCVECIALEQCADCYGKDTKNEEEPRCKEVVRAYLNQDYVGNKEENRNG